MHHLSQVAEQPLHRALGLTDGEHARIVDLLEREPKPCVLRNGELVDFWRGGRELPKRPLNEYIGARFKSVADFGNGFQLMVPK